MSNKGNQADPILPFHSISGEDAVRALLEAVGEDPTRDGLIETPKRVLKALREMTEGYHMDPAKVMKAFDMEDTPYDEMIVMTDIPFQSMCEHHMLPFYGTADIGYIPTDKWLGLSKLARVVNIFARRLQVQERMTVQIADAFKEHLQPKGVGVIASAAHMCMECRGVRTPGTLTTTTALRGIFKTQAPVRDEFFSTVAARKRK